MPDQSDTTNSDTRISYPGVTLLWPNGGETVLTGVRDTVRFSRTLVFEPLRVELNRDYPGGVWESLISDLGAESTGVWTVRLPAAEHARLRVVSQERPEILDESDADFVLRAPQMVLESPNGGEELAAGVSFMIHWSAAEHNGSVRILLNRAYPSGEWETVSSTTYNDGEYSWLPTPPASAACRIRIVTVFDPATYVESAADFSITVLAADESPQLPSAFALSGPHPNPFNSRTDIALELPMRTHVDARVFNRLGQEVAVLANEILDGGRHRLVFDAAGLPSGIYFVRVKACDRTEIIKAALIK